MNAAEAGGRQRHSRAIPALAAAESVCESPRQLCESIAQRLWQSIKPISSRQEPKRSSQPSSGCSAGLLCLAAIPEPLPDPPLLRGLGAGSLLAGTCSVLRRRVVAGEAQALWSSAEWQGKAGTLALGHVPLPITLVIES